MSNGILTINYDSATDFCSLIHQYDKRFSDYVRFGVKPLSYRRWDAEAKCWEVHIAKLAMVVLYAKSHFEHVDYRSLPQKLQIRLVAELQGKATAQEAVHGSNRAILKPDPYLDLYVQQNAPWCVIRAAHRALVLTHHPDRGGSPEAFRKVQEAYDELLEKHRLGKEPGE
jgi:hypothetical protein